MRMMFLGLALLLAVPAAKADEAMTLERLGQIVQAVDPEAEVQDTVMRLTVEDIPIFVVTDPANDRMRAMVPIRSVDEITPEELYRMMQANFDTALDARYAIAQDRLWAVFIHPFQSLEKDQLISGIGQTVNLALTYGNLYTGGALAYRGGDSPAIQRELIEKLLKKGEPI